ncbi:MAG: sterol desaturase family protein [Burkholderiales bacterium]|nr:sterol desaturase family protein [Burkholderiales bacterium]
MNLFTLEHSKSAYRADFVLYGIAVALLAVFLLVAGPRAQRLGIVAFALVGLGSWSAMEYALHRFVLHGLQPFRRWHAAHHQRPRALIFTSTILSATLIAILIFLPTLLLGDLWRACALTLGLLTGYLGYAITHHAIHHWRADNAWLKDRKRWHALHHHSEQPGCYGVTSTFWDQVFGSTHRVVTPTSN